MIKLAMTIAELISRAPAEIKSKAKEYSPLFVRSSNNTWVYNVGDYTVRIKFKKIQPRIRSQLTQAQYDKLRKIKDRDTFISCTCNFWKWNGPDFNAALNGCSERQRSDLSDPVVRDPEYKYLTCKHVHAALLKFKRDVNNAE